MANFFGGKSSGFTSVPLSKMMGDAERVSSSRKEKTIVWTTEKIDKLLDDYANGEVDIRLVKPSPFLKNDQDKRKPGLIFQYTKEERDEWKKCAADPLYFASKYAKAQTDDGIQLLKYRPEQKAILRTLQNNRFSILMASRQIGKCHLFDTEIVIQDSDTGSLIEMPFFELYFNTLKRQGKLTVSGRLKWFLYRIRYFLTKRYGYIK